MSTGCQKDRQRDRQTARQTDRQKDRQKNRKKDGKIFQLTHQNKRCSECQLDVRKIVERQKYRQTDRRTDRFKTERLFSLVIKIKVVENVNRMSEK